MYLRKTRAFGGGLDFPGQKRLSLLSVHFAAGSKVAAVVTGTTWGMSFMNNQKQQELTPSGQHFQTRKSGGKERFDPTPFQDCII